MYVTWPALQMEKTIKQLKKTLKKKKKNLKNSVIYLYLKKNHY